MMSYELIIIKFIKIINLIKIEKSNNWNEKIIFKFIIY